jgi:acyl transferase domain-containing protein/NAD(P)-dependent dehydrogenase (short-subunit alcohol dehydrogenase family)|tara:strand:- start:4477 stop:11391 length:6915 start_codon:yes stop_codon:yes gene_type:complete
MTDKINMTSTGIAVVGASALFPGSADSAPFWSNILDGKDFMTDVPADHWLIEDYYHEDQSKAGKTYATRGAFIPKVDFDPMEYGMPPNQLSSTDSAQLLAVIMAKKVLEDAYSVQFGKVDKKDISVILGIASATELVGQMAAKIQRPNWIKGLREAGIPESQVQKACDLIEATYPEWDESTFPGLLGNVVAGRIANRLDLGGTNCVIDAACASSLGAVAMAMQELQAGHSDLVITGGADALNDIFMYMCFSKTPALSPTGDCRPFSDKADGTMLGEGLGMVALRRLADAERDGDRIYAVIRGLGSSSDGKAKSIYAPRAEGQELALRRAYERAGYGPEDVDIVEAHGTATKAGDLAEFSGLRRAFASSIRKDKQYCALGSVKSQIGHTKAAAGSASLFKMVMALHHKVLPPTIKVDKPNPALELEDSPFYLNTQARPWIKAQAQTRKASVSSFGFGGSNFHMTLEEYTSVGPAQHRLHNSPAELILFGAASDAELKRCVETFMADLAQAQTVRGEGTAPAVAGLARTSQCSFDAGQSRRLALLAESDDDAIAVAKQALQQIDKNPEAGFSVANKIHYGTGSEVPKTAFVFPGQGSQYVNMGAELAMEFSDARNVWDSCAAVRMDDELDLHQVVFPIPAFSDEQRQDQLDLLTKTHWAQPAIGAVSASMLNLLAKLGIRADATAGHSYGEISALYAAGAITSLQDLVSISRKRGDLMTQAASTPGSMTAVMTDFQDLDDKLESWQTGVCIANINSPRQVVMAGKTPDIEATEKLLAEAGVKFRRLPVATAFHSDLVSPSATPFNEYLSGITLTAPSIPVYANTTASVYPSESDAIRSTLAWQLANPVKFQEQIEAMYAAGIRLFLEVGPNATLSGMIRDCLGDREFTTVALDSRKQDGRAGLWNALGMLAAQGMAMNFEALWTEFVTPVVYDAQKKRSPVTVAVNGTNLGKPYPPVDGSAGMPAANPEPAPEAVAQVVQGPGLERPGHARPGHARPVGQQPSPQRVDEAAPAYLQSQPGEHQPANPVTGIDVNWTAAFQTLQQLTLDAQKAFQKTLSESHSAFLQASETAFKQLGQLGQLGQLVGASNQPGTSSSDPSLSESEPTGTRGAAYAALDSISEAFERAKHSVTQVARESLDTPAAPLAESANANSADFESMLMGVVSEKTGYPVEMLELEMELEAGLGIDSIKRVEILSSLQDQLPHLADVDTAELATLNTLGEVLEFARASAPTADSPVTEPTVDATATVTELEALLMAVVAEKTGYPVEMLELEMELEAGLGIDSIKRVEILSSLQDQLPHLADIDTAELAALNTLGEVLEFARVSAPVAAVPVTESSAAATAAGVDFEALLMAVVAEKTGYPVEMLELEMELEAGLGIDSIKRVEILSSLQDQLPHLADIDTAELAALNTLGEVLEFARGSAPPSAVTDATPLPAGEDFEALLMAVVAEKTGYPVEMLELDMELEAGLGIDSIKRVEILSSLQDQLPHLADVDTTELAELNTLSEVLAFATGERSTKADSGQGADLQTDRLEHAPGQGMGSGFEPMVVQAVLAPSPGIAMQGIRDLSVIYIVRDDLGVAEVLATKFSEAHLNTAVVDEAPDDCDAAIILCGLNDVAAQGLDGYTSLNKRVFDQARRFAAKMSSEGRLLVTVQDTGGDFGISGANVEDTVWSTGIAALAKTAAREWPKASVKAIDIAASGRSKESIAEAVFVELMAGGPETEVGLINDARITLQAVAASPSVDDYQMLQEGDVVVVSGGARGVTAACLQELAAQTRLKYAILARTPLLDDPDCVRDCSSDAEMKKALLADHQQSGRKVSPMELSAEVGRIMAAREARDNIAKLESAGASVSYLVADVSDRQAVDSALEEVRTDLGPIKGVIHAAGVLADKPIHEKTDDQFARVFNTKVRGLQNLLHATSNDSLSHMACFSSVAARSGNPGQVDYAMANEILNRVCQQEQVRRAGNCLVKSFGWGPWDGGMVNPALKSHFESMGAKLIPIADGARFFASEMTDPTAGVETLYGSSMDAGSSLQGNQAGFVDLWVHKSTHGYIESHTIRDKAVVPMMMANEWCMRVAASLATDLEAKIALGTRNLKVLKGILLENFENCGDWLRIAFQNSSTENEIDFVIEGADNVKHYQMTVRLGQQFADRPDTGDFDVGTLPAWDWDAKDLYGERLFHGPEFRVISELNGISDHACAGTLQVNDPNGLSQVANQTHSDVPIMDGGVQLGLLWERYRSGGECLPTGFSSMELFQNKSYDGPIKCLLTYESASNLATEWGLKFVDQNNAVVAVVTGLMLHVLPVVPPG